MAAVRQYKGISSYHPGSADRCPECGQSNWQVGRSTAECGYCSTALPIAVPLFRVIRLRAAA